jgi:signal transduction histidine kinase
VELVASLFMLALVLAIAMWIQVGLGLAPLTELGAEVAEIARGQRNRLDAGGPTEIQPLVDEINGLLDEREKEIALARNRAADLAHGLKTPLTALAADARLLREKGESDIAQSLERVSDAMQRHVAPNSRGRGLNAFVVAASLQKRRFWRSSTRSCGRWREPGSRPDSKPISIRRLWSLWIASILWR